MSEEITENERWILHCSVDDVNWRYTLGRLKLREALYCLEHETRKTAIQRLRARVEELTTGAPVMVLKCVDECDSPHGMGELCCLQCEHNSECDKVCFDLDAMLMDVDQEEEGYSGCGQMRVTVSREASR